MLQDYVTSSNVSVVETTLAWLVHIVGSIMRMKGYPGGQSNEVIDAELIARILKLINVMYTGSYVQAAERLIMSDRNSKAILKNSKGILRYQAGLRMQHIFSC
ncbi:uncharacterized protein LOC109133767 [Beta vulgaris subsp. vulgaris]|nr:uncharacterized protein LOC109133767 [Beta vulgaris subsp. vulgaris]